MELLEQPEKRLTLNVEGHMLDIITQQICEGEWTLCVENCHGVRSHWFERFITADAALEEARKAILEEGIDEFISNEGFDFLA